MKKVLVISAFVTMVFGASIPEDAQATIVQYDNTNDGKGNYEFRLVSI